MLAALIAPLLMLILLGCAFGGSITNVPVAIIRYSHGEYSSRLVDMLRAEQSCSIGGNVCGNALSLKDVSDLDTAERMLRQGLVKAIIHIPSDFDGTAGNSKRANIITYIDNTDPLSASAISGSILRVTQQLSVQMWIHDGSVTTDQINFYRNVQYIEFMAPGSIVQAIFIASLIGGGISILMDKQRGVMEGYLVTPLKHYEMIIGVLLAGGIKAVFSSLAMLFLAILIAGVHVVVDVVSILLMIVTIVLTALGLISMMNPSMMTPPARSTSLKARMSALGASIILLNRCLATCEFSG